jgi:hypothetical protein
MTCSEISDFIYYINVWYSITCSQNRMTDWIVSRPVLSMPATLSSALLFLPAGFLVLVCWRRICKGGVVPARFFVWCWRLWLLDRRWTLIMTCIAPNMTTTRTIILTSRSCAPRMRNSAPSMESTVRNVYIIIIFLSSIRSKIETCYGCYKTESFHLFKGLPKFIFPFGWYFWIIFGILSELILSTWSFQCFLYWHMNSVICEICNSVKMSSFLLWPQRVYPAVLPRKRISADINLLSSVLLTVHASLP